MVPGQGQNMNMGMMNPNLQQQNMVNMMPAMMNQQPTNQMPMQQQQQQQNNMGGQYNQKKPPMSPNDVNEKYKTERCRHYETHKNCALGDKCHFAHGDEELRKPDDILNPELLEIALKSQQWQNCNQQNQIRNKQYNQQRPQMQGPPNQMQRGGSMRQNNQGGMRGGYNNRGGRDQQPNNFNKPRPYGNNQGGQMQKTQNAGINGQGGQPRMINQKYKTVQCKYYDKYGQCQYGDKCSFAHGESDVLNEGEGGGNEYMGNGQIDQQNFNNMGAMGNQQYQQPMMNPQMQQFDFMQMMLANAMNNGGTPEMSQQNQQQMMQNMMQPNMMNLANQQQNIQQQQPNAMMGFMQNPQENAKNE